MVWKMVEEKEVGGDWWRTYEVVVFGKFKFRNRSNLIHPWHSHRFYFSTQFNAFLLNLLFI